MIGKAKVCLLALLPLVLAMLAGCASQTPVIEAAALQNISEGEVGCLKTHGPLIKADSIDQKTIVFWDLEENIYRVGTRDICLATADTRDASSVHIVRPRSPFSARQRREICTKKMDSVKVGYFVSQMRRAKMNCLITSVSVISEAEYEALIAATTGGEARPRSPRRMN